MTINRPILQAPWRTQRQRVGAILLGIVAAVMVAALYLSVASQSTLIGREVQTLEREINLAKQENANLKTELARLLSFHAVETRSDGLGFYPAEEEETHYLLVPGYSGRETVVLLEESKEVVNTSLPSDYSLSLFDWFELKLR